MPWSSSRPRHAETDAKYRTPQHRRLRSQFASLIDAGHRVECTSPRCLHPGIPITTSDGRHPLGLNLGHEDDGVTYRGPEHRDCNVRDGARRGRAKQDGPRWFVL